MGKKEEFERATKKVEDMIKEVSKPTAATSGFGHARPDRCCPGEYIGR